MRNSKHQDPGSRIAPITKLQSVRVPMAIPGVHKEKTPSPTPTLPPLVPREEREKALLAFQGHAALEVLELP